LKEINNILWKARFYKKKNWLKVRKILQEGIEEFPQEKSLHMELAELYINKKLFKKAIETYQRILEFDDNDSQVFFLIGNCFLFLKEYKIAIEYYDKIKHYFPEFLYNKAVAYTKIGRKDKGVEIIEKLLKFSTTSEIPFIFLAELHFSQHNYSKAIEVVNITEKKFGKNGNLFYLRGLAFSRLFKWIQAYIEFQAAEKMKFSSSHFYRSYGLTSEKIGKTPKAIYCLLKSINLAPSDPTSYIELIKLYLSHNKIFEAYSVLKFAQKAVPFSFPLSILRTQIMDKLKL